MPEARPLLDHEQLKNSLEIYVVGKPGTGKSSLVSDLLGPSATVKPNVATGMRPHTMEVTQYDIPLKGGISVSVYDTPGMYDAEHNRQEMSTIKLIGNVSNNDASAILLVCMKMHDRLDESAFKMIAAIEKHKKQERFGISPIWRYAVIALTEADCYPREDWLESKKWWEREERILKREFEKSLQDSKDYLRELFTRPEGKARPGCLIGMTEKEFDELDIPILPTSTLKHMSKMRAVGQEYWFDYLLVECCKREQGMALVNIHSDRLAVLPGEIVRKVEDKISEWKSKMTPEFLEVVKALYRGSGASFIHMASMFLWHHIQYSATESPRFESRQ